MIDINNFISTINRAVRGEDIRDAIVGALTALNSNDSSAYTLNGHPSSYFAKQSDMDKILPLDPEPIQNSTRAVSSGGIYNYALEIARVIDVINGETI